MIIMQPMRDMYGIGEMSLRTQIQQPLLHQMIVDLLSFLWFLLMMLMIITVVSILFMSQIWLVLGEKVAVGL